MQGPNPASDGALDPDAGGDGRQGAAGRRSPAHGLPPDCCCSLPVPAARRSVAVRAEEAAAPAAPVKKPEVGPKRGSYVSAAAAAGSTARHGGSTDRASGSMLQCCHGAAMPRQAWECMRMCNQTACQCHTTLACRRRRLACRALMLPRPLCCLRCRCASCAPSPTGACSWVSLRVAAADGAWVSQLWRADGGLVQPTRLAAVAPRLHFRHIWSVRHAG